MFNKQYNKYKSKYLSEKRKLLNNKSCGTIIHIAGASGSGKTYLGNKLAKKFKNKIVVKDLDDLRNDHLILNEKTNITAEEFIKTYKFSYQKYIDDFIENNNKKPIIFVGVNTYILGEIFYFKNKESEYPKAFFDVHANYKFYIDSDMNTILKQRFNREFDDYINWFCNWIKGRKEILFENLLKDESKAKEDTCIALTRIMNFEKTKKDIDKLNKFYFEKRYVFLSQEKIYEATIKLLR